MLNNINLNKYEKTWAHNPEATGSNPDTATRKTRNYLDSEPLLFYLVFPISAHLGQVGTLASKEQPDTGGRPNRKIRENHLHPSLHMTAPFAFLVSYGFGFLYFVEFGLHGLIISGQSSYGYVLCLVVGQTKLVLGT